MVFSNDLVVEVASASATARLKRGFLNPGADEADNQAVLAAKKGWNITVFFWLLITHVILLGILYLEWVMNIIEYITQESNHMGYVTFDDIFFWDWTWMSVLISHPILVC